MKKLGSISEFEMSFLKQGVLFFTLKTRYFSIRLDAIMERKNQIQEGNYQHSDERVVRIVEPIVARKNNQRREGISIAGLESLQAQKNFFKQITKNVQITEASPVKKHIESFHSGLEEFDINKISKWDAYSIRQYIKYAYKYFRDGLVMIRLMQIDVQLQTIENNYQTIKDFKSNEKQFNELIEYLQKNYRLIKKDAKEEIAKIEKDALRAALLNGNSSSATLGKSSSMSKSIALDSRNKTFTDMPIENPH